MTFEKMNWFRNFIAIMKKKLIYKNHKKNSYIKITKKPLNRIKSSEITNSVRSYEPDCYIWLRSKSILL